MREKQREDKKAEEAARPARAHHIVALLFDIYVCVNRKEEKKAAKKEKVDAGLAAAREQERQRMEKAGPELLDPEMRRRSASQLERRIQATKAWKKSQNQKTWSKKQPRSTCCGRRRKRASRRNPPEAARPCVQREEKLAGFAKAPAQESGRPGERGHQSCP